MRVVEEMAEMMERDKEEGWTEVAEEYEEMETGEWGYEDAEERAVSGMEDFMGRDFNENDFLKDGYMEESLMEAAAAKEGAEILEERALADDNRGMGVIEIVLIIVVLIGLVVIFRGGIQTALGTIIEGIGNLVNGFF